MDLVSDIMYYTLLSLPRTVYKLHVFILIMKIEGYLNYGILSLGHGLKSAYNKMNYDYQKNNSFLASEGKPVFFYS